MTILSKAKQKDILTKLTALQLLSIHYDDDPVGSYVAMTRIVPDLIYEIGGLKALQESQHYIFEEVPHDTGRVTDPGREDQAEVDRPSAERGYNHGN